MSQAIDLLDMSATGETKGDRESTPGYPLRLFYFNKLFWRSSTNVRVDVYRLDPRIFATTLCLVAKDLGEGKELNR